MKVDKLNPNAKKEQQRATIVCMGITSSLFQNSLNFILLSLKKNYQLKTFHLFYIFLHFPTIELKSDFAAHYPKL